MLNGTLCATERALCCLVENYQTPEVRPHELERMKLFLTSPAGPTNS
jgi:seryl-tRNA synthetase